MSGKRVSSESERERLVHHVHELERLTADVLRHRLAHPAALPYVAQQVVGAILGALEPVLDRDPIRDIGTAIEEDPRRLLVDHLQ